MAFYNLIVSISTRWGTAIEECALPFPCDQFVQNFDAAYYRGVTIYAPKEIIFRWLCQMRVAPYSYDWIDNGGKRSPQHLIDGLDSLEIGQTVMSIFELIAFEVNHHLTIRYKPKLPSARLFGDVLVSYVVLPQEINSCRLLAKLIVTYPRSVIGKVMKRVLPWGDLIMMRQQLLNFKRLAETSNRSAR